MKLDVYEVKRDVVRGAVSGLTIWLTRSAAEAEAHRLAKHMASRSKSRELEQDDQDKNKWNVTDVTGHTFGGPERSVTFTYYVVGRVIQGDVIDQLGALAEESRQEQIERLGTFLLQATDGPHADEGAVDVAIRVIREYQRPAVDRLADLAK
jgi:hypothetical protein